MNQNTFAAEMLKPDLNEKFVPEILDVEITGLAKSERQMKASLKVEIKVKKNGIWRIRVGINNLFEQANSECSVGQMFELQEGYENGYKKPIVPVKTISIDNDYSINTYSFVLNPKLPDNLWSFCNSNKYYFSFVEAISTSDEYVMYSHTYDKNGDFYPLLFIASSFEGWYGNKSINPPCTEFKVRTDSYGVGWRVACDLTFDLSPSNAKIRIISYGLVPKLGIAKKTSNSFEMPILNYSEDYDWVIESSKGQAIIQDGKIKVSGLSPGQISEFKVTTSRAGYTDEILKTYNTAEFAGYKDSDTLMAEADAKAAAEIAKKEADAKVAAEIAKKEADAKVAADKATAEIAKKEADAKAAAELKAKQEADAKIAADKAAGEKIIADAKAEAARILAAAKAAAAKKKVTITCIKGKSVKKVTAVKPVCPKGYKKK